MATAEVVPPAPAAAPSPAPASAAPSSVPASSTPAPAQPVSSAPPAPGPASPKSGVDPAKFPIREDYARELLKEKLAAIPAVGAEAPAVDAPVEGAPGEEPAAEQSAAAKEDTPAPEAAKEEDFQLEPEVIVTPEVLTQMVRDNAEFGKLLETDPTLKGQLYKTAREAAELKPYREIPDLDSAKNAQAATATWNDVQNTFLGSTTREGTVATLAKIAELSCERDANGEILLENGEPVIGDDFYGFVDHVVGLDLENRSAEVEARLQSNMYRSEEERDRDQTIKAALEVLREETAAPSPAKEALPESLQRKREELDRRERELNQRRHSEKIEERRSFEAGLQQEAQKRINDGIAKIVANVEKQGAVVSPYLKNIFPKAIGAKLLRKIQANPSLQGQMQELQELQENWGVIEPHK